MDFNVAVKILERDFGKDLLGAMQRAREKAWSAELTVEQYDAYKTVLKGMSKLFAPREG